MARKLSPLAAEVTLNINQWSASVKQVQRDGSAIARSLEPAKRVLKEAGTAFTAAGAALGGTLLAAAKKAADFGDTLLDASKRTGIATEKLAAYKLLAEQSGTSFEAVTGSLAKLSKSIFDAAQGTGEAQQAFRALGINVKDSAGRLRNAGDIFPEIVDRLSKMEDGTEKVALAQRLMGRSAADLIPLINEGREGIQRAEAATRKYNTALTRAEAALGDQFNDALGESKTAMQRLANAVGVALLPKLTELVNKGNDWIAVASSWVKAHPNLTVAIGKTAAALTGAGGLLLGLTGVVTIAPKVYESLLLVGKGIRFLNSIKLESAAIHWITNLTAAGGGVSNVGKLTGALINLRAGVALVGEAFKTGGLIAGIQAIRSLTVLPAWMSPVAWAGLAVSVYKLSTAFRDMNLAREEAMKAIDREFNTAQRLANLTGAKGGVRVTPRPGETAAEFSARAQAAEYERLGKQYGVTRKAGEDLLGFIRRLVPVMQEANGITRRSTDSTNKYGDAADAAGNSVKQLQESFMSALRPADALDQELRQLQKAHISNADIVAVYSDQIIDAVKVQKEHGFAVSANIAALEQQAQALMKAKTAQELYNEARKQPLELVHAPIPDTLPPPSVRDEAVRSLGKQKDAFRETAKAAAEMLRANHSASEVEAALGIRLDEVSRSARELNVQLDPLDRKTIEQAASAETLRRSWGDAFASISDRLVDMTVDFDFSFRRLGDIGKSTAKELGRSFLDGFFKPFKDGLEGLGETAAKKLGEIVFGASSASGGAGASTGGLFSGIGTLIGQVFGKNNGAAAGTTGDIFGDIQAGLGPALAGIKPLAGPGGPMQMTGLMGTLNPIGMGLGIANQAVQLWNSTFGKIGQGRKAADEIVKSQQAFEGEIERVAGDLELSATNRLKQIDNLWEATQRNWAAFAGNDPNRQKVLNQAFATDVQLVSQIRTNLLKQGAVEGGGSGAGGPIIHGDLVVQIMTTDEIRTPEDIIRIIRANKQGVTAEIARAVFDMEGALVTR